MKEQNTDLDNMKLPRVNERKLKSHILQNLLKCEFLKAIKNVEAENDYEFEPYEVDNALLDMIKRNHESYLNSKFGWDKV
jgi:hypothetical protein